MFHVKRQPSFYFRGCKMAFSKEYKALMKELNKTLDDWESLGVKPNEVRQAEHMLELFYEWSGKNPKHTDRFSTRLKLTNDQQEELEQIAQSFVNMDIFADEQYEENFLKAWETAKNNPNNNFKNIEEYKNWVDAKDRFEQERLLASVMSYYEYEMIKRKYSRKYKQEINENDLKELIINIYNSTGMEKEDLYEFIYKNINKNVKKQAEKFKK